MTAWRSDLAGFLATGRLPRLVRSCAVGVRTSRQSLRSGRSQPDRDRRSSVAGRPDAPSRGRTPSAASGRVRPRRRGDRELRRRSAPSARAGPSTVADRGGELGRRGRRAERAPGRPGRPAGRGRRPRGRRTRTGRRPRPGPAPGARARRRRAAAPGRRGRGRRRTGRPPSLPWASSAGAGDLVGDRRRGDRELVAVGVGAAGVVLERPAARRRRSRCRSGPRARPGPAVSVTTTPTLRAGAVAAGRRAAPRAEASGSSGSSTTVPASTLEASMPAAAMVRPWRVRTIVVGPRRATTRTVSPGSASSRVPGPDPALGLADHLAGHHHDVAVGEVDQRQQQRRQVVAGAGPRARRRGRATLEPCSSASTSSHGAPRPSRRWRRGRSSSAGRRGRRCRPPVTPGDLVGVDARRPASRRAPRRPRGRRSAGRRRRR